jgi:hypothetical protein
MGDGMDGGFPAAVGSGCKPFRVQSGFVGCKDCCIASKHKWLAPFLGRSHVGRGGVVAAAADSVKSLQVIVRNPDNDCCRVLGSCSCSGRGATLSVTSSECWVDMTEC